MTWYPIFHCIFHILFIHLSNQWTPGLLLPFGNCAIWQFGYNAAMSMGVHISESLFSLLWDVYRSEIAESYDYSIFNFLR